MNETPEIETQELKTVYECVTQMKNSKKERTELSKQLMNSSP